MNMETMAGGGMSRGIDACSLFPFIYSRAWQGKEQYRVTSQRMHLVELRGAATSTQ